VQEVPPGPPDQVRRLERYRQEHPDVDIEPPGARSAVWRAFRDGDLIAYGFTLMVFLERLEDLPEPLATAQDFGRRPCDKASSCPCQQSQSGRDGQHGMQDCGLRAPPARRGRPCELERRVSLPGSGRAVRPDLASRHRAAVRSPGKPDIHRTRVITSAVPVLPRVRRRVVPGARGSGVVTGLCPAGGTGSALAVSIEDVDVGAVA
jgi:hypothetical protein